MVNIDWTSQSDVDLTMRQAHMELLALIPFKQSNARLINEDL